MPSVTGLTAARMKEIENASIISGTIVGDNLVLVRKDGIEVHAGNVRGAPGPQMPAGSVTAFAGVAVPLGWLLCFGQELGRDAYADLFAAIGTTYGSGNGSTTFNIPDVRGRGPVGLDNMGGSDAGRLSVANVLGGTGGAQTHDLSINEIPSHNHGGSTGSTTPSVKQGIGGGGPGFLTSTTAALGNSTQHTNAHSHSISSQGGGQPHNNMQPYILMNYIIKT